MRYTEYHAGKAVIKDKNKLSEAMEKLARLEDAEEKDRRCQWIPCSERLPEKHVDVLVDFGDENPIIAWYSHVNDTWKNSSTDYVINVDVIAWQPLPEPYNPGKEKRHTNADRIRDMSDEDLVEFMYSSDIPWCDDKICREDDNGCRECLKKWLRSEVEVSDEQ